MNSQHSNSSHTMSVWEHLSELRLCLIRALWGIVIASCGGWFATPYLLELLQHPLVSISQADTRLNFETVGGALDLRVTLSIWVGIVTSSPWWIYHIGRFIWPGLKKKEKIHALSFGLSGALFFLAGCITGAFFIPKAVDILLSFVPDNASALLRVDAYVRFCVAIIIGCGLSMLLPVILVALNRAHLLKARRMIQAWRWVTVSSFIFAAIVNPLPNPLPMTIQAFILIALYWAAVGLSAIFEKVESRKTQVKLEEKKTEEY